MFGLFVMVVAAAVMIYGVATERSKLRTRGLIGVGVGAVLSLMAATAPPTSPSTGAGTSPQPPPARSSVPKRDVEAACWAYVRDRLKAPSTAKLLPASYDNEPTWSSAEQEWLWFLEIEAQNSFGVPLVSTWACRVFDDEFVTATQLE